MSFEKAQQLIDLATYVAARRMGVTTDDVIDRLGVSKRTAQRILHTLELRFPDTETHFDDEGRKRWRLDTAALRDLLTLTPDELAALDMSIGTLERNAQGVEADMLRSLREKIVALVPRNRIARLETDHDALLEAQGLAARPGPVSRLAPQIAGPADQSHRVASSTGARRASRRPSGRHSPGCEAPNPPARLSAAAAAPARHRFAPPAAPRWRATVARYCPPSATRAAAARDPRDRETAAA